MSGRSATARIGSLAAGLARGGLTEVAARLRLPGLVGRDPQSVLAALIDWIAPAGGLREEGITRMAAIATLSALFDDLGVAQTGVEALGGLTAEGVRVVVALSITNYVDARFQQELISRVERSAISEQAANQLAGQVHEFIETNVRLDLADIDVMALDWEGSAGKQFVDGQFVKAYELLGGAP